MKNLTIMGVAQKEVFVQAMHVRQQVGEDVSDGGQRDRNHLPWLVQDQMLHRSLSIRKTMAMTMTTTFKVTVTQCVVY
jgi:hypothetical protein